MRIVHAACDITRVDAGEGVDRPRVASNLDDVGVFGDKDSYISLGRVLVKVRNLERRRLSGIPLQRRLHMGWLMVVCTSSEGSFRGPLSRREHYLDR